MSSPEGFKGSLANVVVVGGSGGLILAYNGTPANGNLIFAVASSSGVDGFGNAYPAGVSLATTSVANSGGNESIRFGLESGTPATAPFIDSIINPLIQAYLEIVGPDSGGGGNRPNIQLIQDLISGRDDITLTTQTGDITLQAALRTILHGATVITGANDSLQVGFGMPAFANIQFGRFSVAFSAQGSVSGALTYPQAFPVGVVPNVQGTVTVGSNLDVLLNWQTTGSNTGRSWRLFQKSGTAITGTANVDWYAIA